MGTIGACGGFAAICGSSLAKAFTMGTIAVPEMKKYGYDYKLSTGAVAAGGVLGVLIPPSLGFILYANLTEESVGAIFMAGFIPGILLALAFMLTVYVISKRDPNMGPAGPKTSFREKIESLRFTWMMIVLLTIPIVFPTVMALGYDPIWFGVVVVMIMEMGMITPPVGMNVFFLSSFSPYSPKLHYISQAW